MKEDIIAIVNEAAERKSAGLPRQQRKRFTAMKEAVLAVAAVMAVTGFWIIVSLAVSAYR